jgi:hypothetical protein
MILINKKPALIEAGFLRYKTFSYSSSGVETVAGFTEAS